MNTCHANCPCANKTEKIDVYLFENEAYSYQEALDLAYSNLDLEYSGEDILSILADNVHISVLELFEKEDHELYKQMCEKYHTVIDELCKDWVEIHMTHSFITIKA